MRAAFISTRALEMLTLSYLIIPTLIFTLGWLTPVVGLPLLAITLGGAALWLRAIPLSPGPTPAGFPAPRPLDRLSALLVLLVLTLVTSHLGIGGWGAPSGDVRARSTILRDLVQKPWPVVYRTSDFVDAPMVTIELADRSGDGVTRGILGGPRPGFLARDPANDLLGVGEGTHVQLAGSGLRQVEAVEGERVWLTPGPIDPARDGFPNTVLVDWRVAGQTRPLVLIYNVGWFLPAALAGKWLSWQGANHFLFLWTVLGLWLGACWFLLLSGPLRWIALVVLISFGGLDVLGDMIRQSWLQHQSVGPRFDHHIEWWAGYKRFSFQSTLANVHWAVHHYIPGLIVPLLAIHQAAYQRRVESLFLLVAFTLIWSPLVFLGTIPVIGALLLTSSWRNLISLPNLVAAPVLAACLLLFYAKPSGAIPHGWVWQFYGLRTLGALALFYVIEFGAYAIAIRPYVKTLTGGFRHLWLAVLGGLAVAPLYVFGWSNDFSMRMSVSLLCVFVLFVTNAIHWLWAERRFARLTVLAGLLFVGSWTGLIDARLAIREIPYPRLYTAMPSDVGVLKFFLWVPTRSVKSNKNQYLSDAETPFLACCLRKRPLFGGDHGSE